MKDRIGQKLGNYQLLRLLGHGGFAEVYLGEHIYLKTQAAIKILFTQLTSNEVEHFSNEARIIAHLEHKHIIRVLEFGVDDSTPYLVMSYAPNGTLRQQHPKGVRLPLPTIVSYVTQVASALQYAHDQRLIHRDVKPENMLLGRHNEVVLSDFGIAVVAQSSRYQQEQDTTGTIAYMAPEQIQAHPRPASDQYALGIVVYEWLSGAHPFTGSFIEIANKQLHALPPPLHDKIPTIPPEVEQVVLTALAKDPRQRFDSVRAFALALEHATQPAPFFRSVLPPMTVASNQPAPSGESGRSMDQTPAATIPIPESFPSTQSASTRGDVFPPYSPVGMVPTNASNRSAKGNSRRIILSGLAGLIGLGMAGTGGWWWYNTHNTHTTTHSVSIPGTLLYTYYGHSDSVTAAAWSPDSKYVASASADTTVQIWNATDGTHLYTYHGHSSEVSTVAWSPDGKLIASVGKDSTIQVWNPTDGSQIYIYRGHPSQASAIAWSFDSKRIVAVGCEGVYVWDAVNGGNVYHFPGHTFCVYGVAWSPDGKFIASGGEGGDRTNMLVWEATTGKLIYSYPNAINVSAIVWSPDNKRIACTSNNEVHVWDASNGTHLYIYKGHENEVFSLTWSPDGKRIGSSDGTIHIWDALDGSHVFTYKGHATAAISWSPDNTRITSCGNSSSATKTVEIWSAV